MLVLTRSLGETIVIAEGEIRVTIVEVRGDKVRVGIRAPRNIDVNREEVWIAIQKEQKGE